MNCASIVQALGKLPSAATCPNRLVKYWASSGQVFGVATCPDRLVKYWASFWASL